MTQPKPFDCLLTDDANVPLPQMGTTQAGKALGAITVAAMGAATATALVDNAGGSAAVNSTIEEIEDIAITTAGGNTYADAATNTAINAAVDDIANALEELIAEINKNVLDVAILKTDLDKSVTDVTAKRVITEGLHSAFEVHGLLTSNTSTRNKNIPARNRFYMKLADRKGRGMIGEQVSTAPADMSANTAGAIGALGGGAITDSGGGVAADATLADIPDVTLATSYLDSDINTLVNATIQLWSDAVKELSDQINKQRVDIALCKTSMNASRTAMAGEITPSDALIVRMQGHGLIVDGTQPAAARCHFADSTGKQQLGPRLTSVTAAGANAAIAVPGTTGALTNSDESGEAVDSTVAAIADIALSTSDTYGTGTTVNAAINAVIDDIANAVKELVTEANLGQADVADAVTQANALRLDVNEEIAAINAMIEVMEINGLIADN